MSQFEGTNKTDGESEFKQYLRSKNISEAIIKKLTDGGLNTLDILKSIDFSHKDWDELATGCNLNAFDKIKLKAVVKPLQKTLPVIVDKEETFAVVQIQNKIKSIENAINLITNTQKEIDTEVKNHTNTIKSTFKELYSLLNKRETQLIQQLNTIANQRKLKLQQESVKLNNQHSKSKQQSDLCNKRLMSPIQLHEIELRKQAILKIAKDINNIKIISNDSTLIKNNKFNVTLDKTLTTNAINSFGCVSFGAIPILISLVDNKNRTVSIKWKLNSKPQQNNNNKLKVEWTETKSNDVDNAEFDEKTQQVKEFSVTNNTNDDVTINIDKLGVYLIRIQYFNGDQWSIKSNIKNVSITEFDTWDPNCKDNSIQISGNSIIKTTNNKQFSAFLTRVVNHGVHQWKFRVDKLQSWAYCIGVWNTKYQPQTGSLWTKPKKGRTYGFAFGAGSGQCNKIDDGGNWTKWGKPVQNGSIVEMTLDLNALSLSYKVNDQDLGKAFDVENGSYRAVALLYYKDSKFTLLSYQSS